jgi:hypothetical protein
MKYILLTFLIFIISCSEAESILERDNSQSVSATPSTEPFNSSNEDLKSLEDRIKKLESVIENNTLALEKLTKSLESSNSVSVQNNNSNDVIVAKNSKTYGKTIDNPVVENQALKINLIGDLFSKDSINLYVSSVDSQIIFEGVDEITQTSEEITFITSDNLPVTSYKEAKISLPKTYILGDNLLSNKGIVKFKHKVIYNPEKDGIQDIVKQTLHGNTFDFEYHIILSSK